MKPTVMADKFVLQKKQLELKRIIRQMRLDQLHSSTVYRNLEHELSHLNRQLDQSGKVVSSH